MPIKPNQEFGEANTTPASPEYPNGAYKNETVPNVSQDGTPMTAKILNDKLGADEALYADVGMTPTNVADTAQSSQKLEALRLLAGKTALLPVLIAQGLTGDYGYFSKGFTINDPNDVGITDSGQLWKYVGSDPLPLVVAAGTVPSAPDWEDVKFDQYARTMTLDEAIAEDAPIGTRYRLSDYYDARYDVVDSSDTGGFYIDELTSGRKLRLLPDNGLVNVRHVGAKNLVDFDFNPIFKYCVKNNLTISFYGCQGLTSTPIDVTTESNRILKIVGDTEDKNNTGIYNLVYTGEGVAINCKEIIHNRFGLAGTLSVTDAIPVGTTGIQASESITHIDSCLRNFSTHYRRNGGFYHTIEGGTLRRGRILHDITGTPAYNSPINATHSDFEIGVTAGGGNGPIVLGGSWEKWTDAIFKSTTTASKFGVHLGATYIENYPTEDVAAGLTSTNGKYTAPNAIVNGDGTVTGFARISCNGITGNVFDLDQPKCIDLTLGLIDQGIGSLPSVIVSGNSCRAMEIKTSVDQGDFSAVDVVSPELANSLSATGYYQDFDGKVKCPTVTRTNELVNGWTASEGFYITVNNGIVTLAARLNPSSATSTTCFSLVSVFHRPNRNLRFTAHTNDPDNPTAEVRVLTNGEISINVAGSVPDVATSVAFAFSYNT